METFELKDKEILNKIKQNIEKRKRNEEYKDDLNRFERENLIKKFEGSNKHCDNLLFGNGPKHYPEREIRSHRKIIGPILVKIRKLIYDEIRMSYDSVLYNQYKFNRSILNILQDTLKTELYIDKEENEDKDIERYLNKTFKDKEDIFIIGSLKLKEKHFLELDKDNLGNKEDRSLNGIILWNIIEKLNNKEVINLLDKSYLKLKRNKFLIINSTNPGALSNFSQEYYKKSISPKIIHPEVCKFILESLRFRNIKIRYYGSGDKLKKLENKREYKTLNENFELLNKILFSPKKYIVIAQK